jgi:hypothetical protein
MTRAVTGGGRVERRTRIDTLRTSMQINRLPAGDGIAWLRTGWLLLRRQPLGLPAMTVIYLLLRYLPMVLIPVLGLGIATFLAPFAIVGMMGACRDAAAGRAPPPLVFAAAFKDAEARRTLVNLGLFHMTASLVIALAVAAFMPDFGDQPPGLEEIVQALPAWLLLTALAAEFVLLMLMWFAPLFAAWHRQPATKALFFSFFALANNRGAFAVFALALVLLLFVAAQVAGVLITLAPSRQVAALLVAPLALFLMTLVQCAAYQSYVSVVRAKPEMRLVA